MHEASIFELPSPVDGVGRKKVMFSFKDSGAGDYGTPALLELRDSKQVDIVVVAAGCAEEMVTDLQGLDLRRISSLDDATPDLHVAGIATDPTMYDDLASRFPDTPIILPEDYPTAARGYLDRYLDQGLRLPDYIAAIDERSKNWYLQHNEDRRRDTGRSIGDLASRIEIIGHPAIFNLARKEIEKRRQDLRGELGVDEAENIIACFASVGMIDLVDSFARGLTDMQGDFSVVFNEHPSEAHLRGTYLEKFKQANIKVYDTPGWRYRALIEVADMAAILPQSTVSLHAARQGLPMLHVDHSQDSPVTGQQLVKSGISPLILPADFGNAAQKLLNRKHPKRLDMIAQLENEFPPINRGDATTKFVNFIFEKLNGVPAH